MTSREKVIEAERRLRAVISGCTDSIVCPFCGLQSHPPLPLCCYNLAELANAILDHVELKEKFKVIERVMDRLSKYDSGPREFVS